jgi:hypothetical protein
MADEWAEFRVKAAAPAEDPWAEFRVSIPADVAKGFGSGLVGGAVQAAGMGGDFRELVGRGVDYVGGKLGVGQENIDQFKNVAGKVAGATPLAAINVSPTSQQIGNTIKDNVGNYEYDPKTGYGKVAKTVGEFVPAAVGGEAGLVRKGVQVLAPALASEAAGYLTPGSKYEPLARAGAALLGGAGAGAVMRPNTAGRVIAEAMGPGVGNAEITAAETLMRRSAALPQPVNLTWQEAIDQVTNGATKLGDVARVAESSQRGGAIMAPFMAQRPGQIENAVRQNLDQVAAPGANPFTIGGRASDAASGALDDARAAINNHTRPLYQAAELDRIPSAQYQQLAQDPRYVAALEQVRNHPEIGPEFAHLPDNAVPVVDQVKKLLQTRAEVTPNADATERFLGSMRGTAGSNAANAATQSSPMYAQAVAEQAQLRGQWLNPLEQGPLGRVASAPRNVDGAAIDAILPVAPQAQSGPHVQQAFQAINARDAEAASNLVRGKMENTFNQASRDLQGGPNQFAGANYRAKLYGHPQAQENLRIGIAETAGQPTVGSTDQLMEALQATGRRQHPGSKTEFNKLLTRSLEGGGPIGETLSSASKINPLAFLRDRYQQYRYGANTDELARLLLDQGAAGEFRRFANSRDNGPGMRAMLAAILGGNSAADQKSANSR